MAPDEITNEVLLEHIQAYGFRFDSIDLRFDKMDIRFDKMDIRFDKMEKRFDKSDERTGKIEKRLDSIDTALQRLYEKRVELTQRVDSIEEKELPRIKQALHLA